jgi:hypothetical protein
MSTTVNALSGASDSAAPIELIYIDHNSQKNRADFATTRFRTRFLEIVSMRLPTEAGSFYTHIDSLFFLLRPRHHN